MITIDTTLPDHLLDTGIGEDAPCTLQVVATNTPYCSNPAEWACKLACCGHIKVVCDQHRDIVASVDPKVFVCTVCRTPRPGIERSWRI